MEANKSRLWKMYPKKCKFVCVFFVYCLSTILLLQLRESSTLASMNNPEGFYKETDVQGPTFAKQF